MTRVWLEERAGRGESLLGDPIGGPAASFFGDGEDMVGRALCGGNQCCLSEIRVTGWHLSRQAVILVGVGSEKFPNDTW